MAGITNVAFRQLCREQGGGLYVCEMITTRALVERNPKTFKMIAFAGDERPRSLQLYGVDPEVTAAAVRMVVQEDLADHVDLNFGCPVPKVTRKGGGAALPWRRRLFARLVRAAVDAAEGAVPVTIKMRKGIDDDHLTYVEAGLAAQDAGVAAVALHARTAAQRYSGTADWAAIATLKQALDVPVLGNGDIWEAEDALRMVAETGADGVVVGRGCLGRPWLFADLEAAFAGRPTRKLPTLGEVAGVLRRHAELLTRRSAASATPASTSASTSPGTSRASRWRRAPPRAGHDLEPGRTRRPARQARRRRAVPPGHPGPTARPHQRPGQGPPPRRLAGLPRHRHGPRGSRNGRLRRLVSRRLDL